MLDSALREMEKTGRNRQKELDALIARDKELDVLFERIYEDICCKGRLSKSSNTVRAAGSSVAVWTAYPEGAIDISSQRAVDTVLFSYVHGG